MTEARISVSVSRVLLEQSHTPPLVREGPAAAGGWMEGLQPSPGRSTPHASQCCGPSITALAPKAELLLSGALWEKVLLASDLRSKLRQSWSL